MIIVMLHATSFHINAADQEIRLEMNDTSIQMGVSTTMSLVISNPSGKAEIVDFSGLDQFAVVSRSQSSSTSIINGKSTKETAVNYTIMPKAVGTYTLQATLKIDGNEYTTNAITVHVSEMDEELSNQSEDIFIRTIPSSEEVYFGQNLIVTYELYSRYQVEDFAFKDDLSCDGFVIEQNQDLEYKPNYLTINGNKYVTYTVGQMVLTPTKTGDFTIPAYQVQANLGSGDFFGTSKPKYLKTEEVPVKVKALPTSDKPSNYKGLVGDISLTSTYSDNQVQGNDPLTLDVSVEGDGNLFVLDKITDYMNLDGFTVYETEKTPVTTISEEGYHERNDYEIILIPKQSGDITIPEADIPYFNTVTGKYDNLKIASQQISVQLPETSQTGQADQSPGTTSGQAIGINQINSGELPEDVLFYVTKTQLVIFLSLLVLAFAVLITLILVRRRSVSEDLKNGKYKAALKKVKSEKDIKTILADIIQDFYKMNINSATQEDVMAAIANEDQKEQVLYLLKYFDYGWRNSKESLTALKTRLKQVIDNMN